MSNSASFDPAGNQLTVGNGVALTYDAENRQRSSGDASSQLSVTYLYDGLNQRVEKFGGNGTTVYVYDAFGQLTAEYSSVAGSAPPCATCYLSYDYLGSLRMVTNAQGQVMARHDYLPFGEEIGSGQAGRDSSFGAADGLHQRFTGQLRDGETTPNLDYFPARYYSGEQARFLSVDPANAGADPGNPQSWNAYSYGLNSPLTYTDPDGQDPVWANCPGCTVTVSGGAQGLSPLDEMFYRGLGQLAAASFQTLQQTQQLLQPALDWISKPRNPTCLAASTAAGASTGLAVGLVAGGPAVPIVAPTTMLIGGGAGWTAGMVSCMSSTGGTGGGNGSDPTSEYTDTTKKSARIPNRKTDVTPDELGRNLEANGFTKSTATDGTPMYTKGNTTYTVYSRANSTQGPTAQVKVNGEVVLKLRLK